MSEHSFGQMGLVLMGPWKLPRHPQGPLQGEEPGVTRSSWPLEGWSRAPCPAVCRLPAGRRAAGTAEGLLGAGGPEPEYLGTWGVGGHTHDGWSNVLAEFCQ